MDEPCRVCGHLARLNQRSIQTPEYAVQWDGVCSRCVRTLERCFAALTTSLRNSREERRERVLVQLIERLNRNGFDTSTALSPP